MSDTWFEWHVSPDGTSEDGCDPREASALKEYLRSTTMTKEATALAITIPIQNEAKSELKPNFTRLWGLIIDALKDLPEHRTKIIQLLVAIQSLPSTCPATERTRESAIHRNELQGFGNLWADMTVSGNWRRRVSSWDPKQREEVRQDFIREASIEAQLCIANISGVSLEWGLGTICDALEDKDAVLDFEIPAAKEWFQAAGKQIFEQANDGIDGYLRERNLWHKGETEKGRWVFWKQRLRSLAENKDQSEEVRTAAKMAYANTVAAEIAS